MYSLFFKKIRPYKKLKKEAERVAEEILSIGPEPMDVQISLQRTPDPTKRFKVSMLLKGLSRPVVISRAGDGVFKLLKQVEKTALDELHRLKDRKIARKRNLAPRAREHSRWDHMRPSPPDRDLDLPHPKAV